MTGEFDMAGTGYADPIHGGCNHWTPETWAELHEAIRADWRLIGPQFLAWWQGDSEQFTAQYASVGGRSRYPGVTPWALQRFGRP